jgi:hypothetical protein
MTTKELLDAIDVTLAKAADGPPQGPRPQGAFLGHAPPTALPGLIVVAPDGSRFNLAVWPAQRERAPAT